MKLELVDDWRDFLTWYSSWSHILVAQAGAAWLAMPEDWRAAVPPAVLAGLALVFGAAGLAGRLIKQKGKRRARLPE